MMSVPTVHKSANNKCAVCQRLDYLFAKFQLTETTDLKTDAKTCCDTYNDRRADFNEKMHVAEIEERKKETEEDKKFNRIRIHHRSSDGTCETNCIAVLRGKFEEFVPDLATYSRKYTSDVVTPYIEYGIYRKSCFSHLSDGRLDDALELATLTEFVEMQDEIRKIQNQRVDACNDI